MFRSLLHTPFLASPLPIEQPQITGFEAFPGAAPGQLVLLKNSDAAPQRPVDADIHFVKSDEHFWGDALPLRMGANDKGTTIFEADFAIPESPEVRALSVFATVDQTLWHPEYSLFEKETKALFEGTDRETALRVARRGPRPLHTTLLHISELAPALETDALARIVAGAIHLNWKFDIAHATPEVILDTGDNAELNASLKRVLGEGGLTAAKTFADPSGIKNAEDFIAFYNPERDASFALGSWRIEQDIAFELYLSLQKNLDRFFDFDPTPRQIHDLLNILSRFGRGQLHEFPSGYVVQNVVLSILYRALGKASASDWATISSFDAPSAAQWDALKSHATRLYSYYHTAALLTRLRYHWDVMKQSWFPVTREEMFRIIRKETLGDRIKAIGRKIRKWRES